MKDNLFEFLNSLLGSIVIAAIGILLIFEANMVVPFSRIILIVFLAIVALTNLINVIFKKENRSRNLISFLIMSLFVLLVLCFPEHYIKFIGHMISFYALVNAVINLIDYFVGRENHEEALLSKIIRIIIYVIFAIVLLILPYWSTSLVVAIGGIYLIIFGLLSLLSNIKQKYNQSFNLAVSVPVLLSAIIPVGLFFKVKNNTEVYERLDDDPYNEDDVAPLEINIYVQGSGFESFGHLDISLDGTIYSYGCHDPNGRTLFGAVGDGVLIKVKREDFLENSMKTRKTMIFNFKLDPSEEQLEQVRARLDKLMQDAVPFDCAAKVQEKSGKPVTADDYISDVYKDTHCDLYKFKAGRFKRYFVFTTNCVLLSDYLIRNQQIDLLNMSGIITPGAYLNYLFQLSLKKDSIVKDVKIYKKSE